MLILLVVLILLSAGVGPWFPWASQWGYRPFGGLVFLVLVVALVLALGGGGGSAGGAVTAHGCSLHW